jgi:hypothetical protein
MIHTHTHMPCMTHTYTHIHTCLCASLYTGRLCVPCARGVPMHVASLCASLYTGRLCVPCARGVCASVVHVNPYAHGVPMRIPVHGASVHPLCTWAGVCASLVYPCAHLCYLCYVSVAVPVASFLVHMGVLWVVHIGPLCTCEIINI